MSVVWAVCGAGRGVGKTRLALELVRILPRAVYAKCGRGRAKRDGPANYFRSRRGLDSFVEECRKEYSHVVVESISFARDGCADITIFIDGVEGKTDFRGDAAALRRGADIGVTRDETPDDWRGALAGVLRPKRLIGSVTAALAAQRNYLFGGPPATPRRAGSPRIRTKLWLETDGSRVFGSGLARLLENVDYLGTLQGAARKARMSYRYAWNLIGAAENDLGRTLVIRRAGGRGGGATELSDDGRRMLGLFRKLNEEISAFADTRFASRYSMLFGSGHTDD